MNQLKGNLAAKIIAVILLAASCLALCGAVAGIVWLDSEGAYGSENAGSIRDVLIERELENELYPLIDTMTRAPVNEANRRITGLRFELLDADKKLLAGNLGAGETVERTRTHEVTGFYGGLWFTAEDKPLTAAESSRAANSVPAVTPTPAPQGAETADEASPSAAKVPEVTPTPAPKKTENADEAGNGPFAPEGTQVCYIRLSWTDKSENAALGAEVSVYEALFPWRYALIGASAVSFVLAVLLFVFLMAAAGHHDASGEVKAGFVEKIPADLLLAFCLLGMAGLVVVINEFFNRGYLVGSFVLASFCLIGAGLLALLWLMSFAVRLKLGVFLESCLVWRVLRWVWKWIKAGFGLLRGVPLVWKWVPLFLALFFLDFAWTMHWRCRNGGVIAIGLVFKGLLLAAALLYLALALRRLRDGAKAIAAGGENVTVDTKYLVGDLKDQAEDLNHIRDGLSRAVDERMKSERLRTELITNVSHDIKTPLTSIVSYVDLLAREEPENEKTREYVEVLQRQSARLKKLTDDLVEASKASTGNLPVNPERLELGVLLDQTAGEYGERLAEKGLDLRVSKPEGPVYVQADPRHLWRMLDNLMNNVLKYAQPGTRVYLDLTRENGRAALSFRNISAEPLNVRAEELTERFVRGDSARSTEGSGLGLAIAASLAKLQNISLALSVDGDLFKVVLGFASEE